MKKLTFRVPARLHHLSIDKAIGELTTDISRRRIRRALDRGQLLCNGERVRKASTPVAKGDCIVLWLDADVKTPDLQASDLIGFEVPGIAVLNKPPHMQCQAKGTLRHQDIVYQAQLQLPKIFTKGAYLCHRLDAETTGALVFATSQDLCSEVMECFRQRVVEKTYLALVWGIPKEDSWEVDCYLSDIKGPSGLVQVVRSGGKQSHTRFAVVARSRQHGISLIRCFPQTGRSHQLRVHLAQLSGLPIIGDKKYDDLLNTRNYPGDLRSLSASHHFLHAQEISFQLAAWSRSKKFKAPLPDAFRRSIELFCPQAVKSI